jgi:hypothetical protein
MAGNSQPAAGDDGGTLISNQTVALISSRQVSATSASMTGLTPRSCVTRNVMATDIVDMGNAALPVARRGPLPRRTLLERGECQLSGEFNTLWLASARPRAMRLSPECQSRPVASVVCSRMPIAVASVRAEHRRRRSAFDRE